MIDFQRKEDCCGCGACHDVCSKQAIIWEPDEEGFSYPHVDKSKCVNCGLCNKVCPIENSESINQKNNSLPIVYAVYHKDDQIRINSTSGGAFWGLAEAFVKRGGYVGGAVFADHFKVKHIVTSDLEQLKKIQGSKYTQSDSRDFYKTIKQLLREKKKVMATGLPCQMAALRQYVGSDENLLIVDLICHSVTSPLAFQKYIESLEKRYDSSMVSYQPKNKEYGGWHNFAFKATFENGEKYVKIKTADYYTELAYGSFLLSRPSCFECHYKNVPQPSDITIGDFWGIENIDQTWDSPKGLSKLVINSKKGLDYFETIDCFEKKEFSVRDSIYDNPRSWSMLKSIKRVNAKTRAKFVKALKTEDFFYCVDKYILHKYSFKNKLKEILKHYSK